jgi:oligopeptide/dipeptide ABC transporter ATP-binding protein
MIQLEKENLKMNNDVLLLLKNVKKYFPVTSGIFKRVVGFVKAVDDITLDVRKGETLGIVGESGCGKSTLGKGIMRLYKPTGGQMFIRGEDDEIKDLYSLSKKESFQACRRIQMIFQDPYASFDPMKNIYSSFDEPMRIHNLGNKEERKEMIAEILRKVNLQPDYMYRYPHEFSGGQRQRICIARAIAMKPELIVCDEPVSALDVSIQAQVLNLMRQLQKEFNLTYIFIAHDLSVVQYMSDRVAVMYLGKIVELADSDSLYNNQVHPYTQALLSAVPIPKVGAEKERILLEGDVPSPINPPSGCRFHPRCRYCMEICKKEEPKLQPLKDNPDHKVACHLLDK